MVRKAKGPEVPLEDPRLITCPAAAHDPAGSAPNYVRGLTAVMRKNNCESFWFDAGPAPSLSSYWCREDANTWFDIAKNRMRRSTRTTDAFVWREGARIALHVALYLRETARA